MSGLVRAWAAAGMATGVAVAGLAGRPTSTLTVTWVRQA